MQQKGAIRANAAAQSGQIWGSAIQGLGQAVGQGYEQYQARKQEQQQQEQASIRMGKWLDFGSNWDGDPKTALAGSVEILGPQLGPKMAESMVSFQRLSQQQQAQDATQAREQAVQSMQDTGRVLQGFGTIWNEVPPEARVKLYEGIRQAASNGVRSMMALVPSDQQQQFAEAIGQMLPEQIDPNDPQIPELAQKFGQAFLGQAQEQSQPKSLNEAYTAAVMAGDEALAQKIREAMGQQAAATRAPETPITPAEQEKQRLELERLRLQIEKAQQDLQAFPFEL